MVIPDMPHLGRVGVAKASSVIGQHILLARDSSEEWWLLYCEPPFEKYRLLGLELFFDNYINGDNLIEDIITSLQIFWIPEGADKIIESEIFDVRKTFINKPDEKY